MPKTKTQDARQNERRRANDYYLLIDPGSGEILGRLLDLSLSGLRFISESPIEANTPLSCQLSFPRMVGNIRELPIELTVRWSLNNTTLDCYEVGCQVHDLTEIASEILTEIMDEFKQL